MSYEDGHFYIHGGARGWYKARKQAKAAAAVTAAGASGAPTSLSGVASKWVEAPDWKSADNSDYYGLVDLLREALPCPGDDVCWTIGVRDVNPEVAEQVARAIHAAYCAEYPAQAARTYALDGKDFHEVGPRQRQLSVGGTATRLVLWGVPPTDQGDLQVKVRVKHRSKTGVTILVVERAKYKEIPRSRSYRIVLDPIERK